VYFVHYAYKISEKYHFYYENNSKQYTFMRNIVYSLHFYTVCAHRIHFEHQKAPTADN